MHLLQLISLSSPTPQETPWSAAFASAIRGLASFINFVHTQITHSLWFRQIADGQASLGLQAKSKLIFTKDKIA